MDSTYVITTGKQVGSKHGNDIRNWTEYFFVLIYHLKILLN